MHTEQLIPSTTSETTNIVQPESNDHIYFGFQYFTNKCHPNLIIEYLRKIVDEHISKSQEKEVIKRINDEIKNTYQITLFKKFYFQIDKFHDYIEYFTNYKNDLYNNFFLVLGKLKKYEISSADVSLTESPSILFRLNLLNHRLNLETFIESHNTVFSLFSDEELIIRDQGHIDDVFSILDKYILHEDMDILSKSACTTTDID